MHRRSDFDITDNSRVYRLKKREKDLDCTRCPPHQKENGRFGGPLRKKKAFQLDPKRGRRHCKKDSYIPRLHIYF